MEKANSLVAETLNDLIQINYDRIEGYRKAAEESKSFDISLHHVFQKMADESRLNVSALNNIVTDLGGKPETQATTSGALYRTWMSVKKAFSSNDRKSLLDSCEYGEDQAQKAYDSALSFEQKLGSDITSLLAAQQRNLKKCHDEIKAMRDHS